MLRTASLILAVLAAHHAQAQSVPSPATPFDPETDLPTSPPPRNSAMRERDGFYSNAPEATSSAARARQAARRSFDPNQVQVAPRGQIVEQCLIECRRMGHDEPYCAKGCAE